MRWFFIQLYDEESFIRIDDSHTYSGSKLCNLKIGE
jgi:hypothetical protein